jgi:hypothetical protein
MRSVELRPQGRLETHRVWRLLSSALPWRRFPVVRRQLQHPRPNADPSVAPFAKTIRKRGPHPLVGRGFAGIQSRKNISDGPSGRSHCWCTDILISKTFHTWRLDSCRSRGSQLRVPRLAPAPPCQAWYGNKATSSHLVEVEVGADGRASAPPSGAAAVAPPAGATRPTMSNIRVHWGPDPRACSPPPATHVQGAASFVARASVLPEGRTLYL